MAIAEFVSVAGEKLVTQWPFFLMTVLVLGGTWVFQNFFKQDALSKIPLVGSEIRDDGKRKEAFLSGAQSMYGKAYVILKKSMGLCRLPVPRPSPVVMVDPKFLPELRNLPDHVLDFAGAIDEMMHPEYTKAEARRQIIPHVVQRDLTPGLTRLNPTIAEEVDTAFQEELPPCKDWTPVMLNKHLLRIVAKVSGRIFVGPELCRTEEYIDMAINYANQVMNAVIAITDLKESERKAKATSLPEVKELRAREQRGYDFVKPLIEARKKAMKEDPDYQRPDDIMQWVLDDGQKKYGQQSDQELTEIQMGLTFAAIHTTTMSTTNAFYCLAVMPEMITELREEVRAVLKEYGTFTTIALQRMKKLDSFMREVMRCYPLSWGSFQRKVHETVVLSNGQVLPAGCVMEVASYNFMQDPEVVPNGHEFDPLRWYRLREEQELQGMQKASVDAANQMVSVSATSLTFGYGRHACPGRFFAANEIKMIIGRAILDYDFKNVDGSMERIPNILRNEHNIPHPGKELLFKRVAI
ncbi:hypothetical protein N0V93_007539 [Gnomoniopsis smithogilvyi]|uniref:Cytochrome P450 n=1 Tax=Gnomoniopsis smithogilvyi TaxID=1191159 RepID=A0A9W9CWN4_9PEZI|nr:hypothetical protein N0V93_007539 [Gnomoniopsis smithogilvyi]